MRIAATADIHTRVLDEAATEKLFEGVNAEADVLVLAGDLTDTGLPAEAETLAQSLKNVTIPILAILGNHDHESGRAEEITKLLTGKGIIMMEGQIREIGGVGFVGTKGFSGGFGRNMVQPFGEQALKAFIRAGINEALELENMVARMENHRRLAILHYAPVKETLEGESPELFPFLGTERLAHALDRQGVDVIIHGHAHHGSPEGRTPGGIPVYNISRFVLQTYIGKPYRIIEL